MSRSQEELQQYISECLNTAQDENHYPMQSLTDKEIAEDLRAYAEGLYVYEIKDLLPYIETWRNSRN